MRMRLLAVGKIKERYLQAGIAEYMKRLASCCRMEIIEIPEARMPDVSAPTDQARALAEEGAKILRQIPESSYCIVLDINGQAMSSEELAAWLANLALRGQSEVTWVIGGAFGLAPAVKDRADLRLSLSRLTFTHQMVRLLLLEQIYRAFKINRGEPYHW